MRESALKLSDMIENLFSFSDIVSNQKKSPAKINFHDDELSKVSRYARIGVITVLVAAMIVAFGICIKTTISWGDTKMNREVDTYEHQLSNWLEKQKSILSMFANVISNKPETMDDYNSAVKFLDGLAKNYPEISVCYMANPYKKNSLIMNNGWVSPDPNWHVEKRPWYIDTEKSPDGFSVSAPYYDDQTGLYCLTISQIVYGVNGEFLDGYAFLVDRNGTIINHPNNNYQLSVHRTTEIFGTEYSEVYSRDRVSTIKDYRDNFMACLAKKNKTSEFTVVVANGWWNIYGDITFLGLFFIILLMICVLIVHSLINRLLSWQDSVNGQLKAASETAMAASKAKSQFLAQMSHEIKKF